MKREMQRKAAQRNHLQSIAVGKENQISHFIAFRIGFEEFAIDIEQVHEFTPWQTCSPLPNQPNYLRGMLRLRGMIIPIFDLRCCLGMGRTEATSRHVLIIATLQERRVALLVDAVSDLLTLYNTQILPIPDMDSAHGARYLSGVILRPEGMVVVLSLEALFARRPPQEWGTTLAA